jgi:hypothetical protein
VASVVALVAAAAGAFTDVGQVGGLSGVHLVTPPASERAWVWRLVRGTRSWAAGCNGRQPVRMRWPAGRWHSSKRSGGCPSPTARAAAGRRKGTCELREPLDRQSGGTVIGSASPWRGGESAGLASGAEGSDLGRHRR